MKDDILSMTLGETVEKFSELGIPRFRAAQVYERLHRRLDADYGEMTNLPKTLRNELEEKFPIYGCEKARKRVSKLDGTVKYLFGTRDGDYVESVVMRYRYGATACVSSQVGCKMGCAFCASSLGGFKRSLRAGEILSQLYEAQKDLGERISRVVLMGTGEPLDNFNAVTRFIELITDKNGLNLSERNISLSTCGIVPKIEELSRRRPRLTLSVSLHAPNDEIRNRIMPINRLYPVGALLNACEKYERKTSRRVSFEYAMIRGFNDSDKLAEELASKLKGTLSHVNLIPVNEVEKSPFKPSEPERVRKFVEILEKRGVNATVRRKLGSDIDAACGQLRLRENRDRAEKGEE